jgi:hypothetical protein
LRPPPRSSGQFSTIGHGTKLCVHHAMRSPHSVVFVRKNTSRIPWMAVGPPLPWSHDRPGEDRHPVMIALTRRQRKVRTNTWARLVGERYWSLEVRRAPSNVLHVFHDHDKLKISILSSPLRPRPRSQFSFRYPLFFLPSFVHRDVAHVGRWSMP